MNEGARLARQRKTRRGGFFQSGNAKSCLCSFSKAGMLVADYAKINQLLARLPDIAK